MSGDPSPDEHLTAPPQRDLWVNRLRMRGFKRQLARMDHDEGLVEEFREHVGDWHDLHGAVNGHADTPATRRNIVLAAVYVAKLKTEAITYTADAVLGAERVRRLSTAKGHLRRTAAAAAIFQADPKRLLDASIWDAWHSRARVVYRLAGTARSLPRRSDAQWIVHAENALRKTAATHPEWVEHLRVERVVRHGPTDTVMVVIRCDERADVYTDDEGAAQEGHHADWLLLAFRDDGYHLIVVDGATRRGRTIGTHIAGELWDTAQEYTLAGEEADPDNLRALIRRLTDKRDDEFKLLEITAEMPGFEGAPTITVTNGGEERIEAVVEHLQAESAFAKSWETVRSAKVAHDGYRLLIEFPRPDAPLLLTFSVKQRPERVSDGFRTKLRRLVHMDIRPRSPKAERELLRVKERAKKDPSPRTLEWWQGLLGEKVDRPAEWQMDAIKALAEDGVVEVRKRQFFGCGDHTFDHTKLGLTWDACDGEVELGTGAADPHDPLAQEADARAECSICKKVYQPRRYRISTKPRLRLTWSHAALWDLLCSRLREMVDIELRGMPPGVLQALSGGRWYRVEYEPLLSPPEVLSAGGRHTMGVAMVRFGGEAERGCLPLAAVLADPGCLAVAWEAAPKPLVVREPPGETYEAGAARPTQSEKPAIQMQGSGYALNEVVLAAGQASGTRVMIALVANRAVADDRREPGRRKRSSAAHWARKLMDLAPGDMVKENTIIGWIKTVNDNYRKGCLRRALQPLDVIDHTDAGYALAAWVKASEFELAGEISNWQTRLHKTRESKQGISPDAGEA